MARKAPQLSWCEVYLGDDYLWWVQRISEEEHWDLEKLGILDPKQVSHLIDLMEPLRDYGLDFSLFENAFFLFRIASPAEGKSIRLERIYERMLDSKEKLFALPDIMGDEKGPYNDLINHLIRLRVKLLNDLIDFRQTLSIEELEDEIRDLHSTSYFEGSWPHFFQEINSILEYFPPGYEKELEIDERSNVIAENIEETIPDLDEDDLDEDEEDIDWEEDEDEGGGENFEDDSYYADEGYQGKRGA